jgi:hypothetical protein
MGGEDTGGDDTGGEDPDILNLLRYVASKMWSRMGKLAVDDEMDEWRRKSVVDKKMEERKGGIGWRLRVLIFIRSPLRNLGALHPMAAGNVKGTLWSPSGRSTQEFPEYPQSHCCGQ